MVNEFMRTQFCIITIFIVKYLLKKDHIILILVILLHDKIHRLIEYLLNYKPLYVVRLLFNFICFISIFVTKDNKVHTYYIKSVNTMFIPTSSSIDIRLNLYI